jgi:hypothetical protein
LLKPKVLRMGMVLTWESYTKCWRNKHVWMSNYMKQNLNDNLRIVLRKKKRVRRGILVVYHLQILHLWVLLLIYAWNWQKQQNLCKNE